MGSSLHHHFLPPSSISLISIFQLLIYHSRQLPLYSMSPSATVSFVHSTCRKTAVAAKSLHSYPTLWDPIDGSLPGSPVPGILQARTLEWVAISFSNAWKWEVKVKSLSRVWLLATPRTAAFQAPQSMEFSRQEYWSGVPLLSTWHNYLYSVFPLFHFPL